MDNIKLRYLNISYNPDTPTKREYNFVCIDDNIHFRVVFEIIEDESKVDKTFDDFLQEEGVGKEYTIDELKRIIRVNGMFTNEYDHRLVDIYK